jgi:hypothetical protein
MTRSGATWKDAGVESADERLHEITLKAMVDHAGSMSATRDAIWERVRKDRILIDALLLPYKDEALRNLLHQVRRDLGWNPATGPRGATIHIPSEEHIRPANSPLERRAQLVSTEWDREHKDELTAERDAEIARLTEKRAWRHAWEHTSASHVSINDKPFWTVCVNEARGWIERTGHSTRFMELVIAGVPDDGRPIEFYRRPDEIDDLWKQAQAA